MIAFRPGLLRLCLCFAALAVPDLARAAGTVKVANTSPNNPMSLGQPQQSVTATITTPDLPGQLTLDVVITITNVRTAQVTTKFAQVTTDMTGYAALSISCAVPPGNMNEAATINVKATYTPGSISNSQTVNPTYTSNAP